MALNQHCQRRRRACACLWEPKEDQEAFLAAQKQAAANADAAKAPVAPAPTPPRPMSAPAMPSPFAMGSPSVMAGAPAPAPIVKQDPAFDSTPQALVITGFGGKPAPAPAPQPEI